MKSIWLSALASAGLLTLAGATLAADIPEACNSYKPAVTGGPMPPPESDTVVIRWLGNANFEFAYKGKVYLFDAYFDRTPRAHNVGFTAADVIKAEAIFVSHAHFDHISDIGPVARQTGAPVVGAPITAETAKKLGVPEKQIVVAKGGETMKFGDATAEIALAQHSTIQPGLTDIYASLYQNDSPPYSEEEKKELARVRALGTFDPKVITEGTLAYGLVFPSGFKAVLIGSAGPITAGGACAGRKARPGRCRHRRLSGARGRRHADRLYVALHRLVQAEALSAGASRCQSAHLGRSRRRAAVRPDPREHAEHGLRRTALSFADLRGRRRLRPGQGRVVQAVSLRFCHRAGRRGGKP